MIDYNELAKGNVGEFSTEVLSDDELNARHKQRLGEIQREKRILENEERAICLSLSDPEAAKRLVGLVEQAAQNIVNSEITLDNILTEPFKDFDENDQEQFDKGKYKTVYNLHNKVQMNPEVKEGMLALKQSGNLDNRKQRHKKKPNDWIGGLANSKLLADMHKRQKSMEERLAEIEIAQRKNEERFSQIGDALMEHSSLLSSLKVLGISEKKLEAYKLRMASPDASVEDLAQMLGKGRATLFRWFKEIEDLVEATQAKIEES